MSSPGLDFPYKLAAHEIKRTGFRGDHPGILEFSQTQRPESIGISHGDQVVVGQQHQRIGSPDQGKSFGQSVEQGISLGMRDQVYDHFRIGIGLKNGAVRFKLAAQHPGIGEIAVMRHGQISECEIDGERLDIANVAFSGSGIPVVADGLVPS